MAPTDPTTDIYASLGIIRNSENSLTRLPEFNITAPASTDPTNPVLSKDITINHQTNTWARLYLPSPEYSSAADNPATKLPLVIYYHGGGFILGSAASAMFHRACAEIAAAIPALLVSVDYRLAPEHRLPAAYDDGEEALHWVRSAADDEWLAKHADFSNCFLMGSSAGGNIAYHVALRAVTRAADELAPVKIRGVILHQAAFGGKERTASEIRLAEDKVLPQSAADVLWELGLPVGAGRDHEYCDPIRAVDLELLERVKGRGWRFLVTGCEGDPLIDRQVQVAKMLRENGIEVVEEFSEGGYHGYEVFDESKAAILYGVLKNFVVNL